MEEYVQAERRMKRSTVQKITVSEFERQASEHTSKQVGELFRSQKYQDYIANRDSKYTNWQEEQRLAGVADYQSDPSASETDSYIYKEDYLQNEIVEIDRQLQAQKQ